MTRGQQILAQLLTADIEAGKVTVKGAELFLAGQRVEPLLTYEAVTPQASSSVRLAEKNQAQTEPRLLSQQSGGPKRQDYNVMLAPGPVVEDHQMKFAALPQDILVRYAQREQVLQDRARAAERASAWRGNFVALPEDPLVADRDDNVNSKRAAGVRPEPARSVFAGCAPLPRDPLVSEDDQ